MSNHKRPIIILLESNKICREIIQDLRDEEDAFDLLIANDYSEVVSYLKLYTDIDAVYFNSRHNFIGGVDGFIKQVKSVDKKVSLVLCSGDPNLIIQERERGVLKYEVDMFLGKPFTLDEFRSTLCLV